jgi:phosphoglycerate dehydrogenase-like enzyme
VKKDLIITILTDSVRLISPDFIQMLGGIGTVVNPPDIDKKTDEDLSDLLRATDIAITGWRSPMLPQPQKGWKLRYICHMTGEMRSKHIPISYLESDVIVTNWGNAFSFATAEGSMALLFSALKAIPEIDRRIRLKSGEWNKFQLTSLYKARVGIYGLSTIGSIVAELLRPYGAIISFYDPITREPPPHLIRCKILQELFSNSDIIMVHAGLNDVTRHSIDYSLLSLLPQGSVFINMARGAIVRETDLARIADEGKIRVGVDVIEDESDWSASPLARVKNVILSGHKMSQLGWIERKVLQTIAIDNIKRFAEGEPLSHVITPEHYRLMS